MILRLFILSIFFFHGCSTIEQSRLTNSEKFEIGLQYFEKQKYQKSKEYFEDIVQNEQGTNLGLESTFLLAKTLFELKEFDEASYNFNYFSMFSKDIDNVEFSQFMKSKCAFESTLPYNKDQTSTGISASYTMGGMTLAGAMNEVNSMDGTPTNDFEGYEFTLSFAF